MPGAKELSNGGKGKRPCLHPFQGPFPGVSGKPGRGGFRSRAGSPGSGLGDQDRVQREGSLSLIGLNSFIITLILYGIGDVGSYFRQLVIFHNY